MSNRDNTKVYNKLVRDKIPQVIASNNQKGEFKTLGNGEYVKELEKKLLEEVNEYLQDKNMEELADITEVVHALTKLHDSNPAELEELRQKKSAKRGGFDDKLFLVSVSDI